MSYILVLASGAGVLLEAAWSLYGIAVALIFLPVIGTRNAWDLVIWMSEQDHKWRGLSPDSIGFADSHVALANSCAVSQLPPAPNPSITAMVVFAPMNESEFSGYLADAVRDYARERVESGQWAEEASLALSRQGFDELLPHGLATPNDYRFKVRDPATRSDVGFLWFAVHERAAQRIAYVYDVLIKPESRRRGFGASTLQALEAEVHSRGLTGIALHVFGHNAAAIALYRKLGYQPTNIKMFKKVRSAGA